ncbi:MAG: hypothetical protein ACRENV_03365, partial [Candidatus Dormibacteria bacterium]
RDGSRRIVAISEVRGFDGDKVQLADIFQYHQQGLDDQGMVVGAFKVENLPHFLDDLAAAGEPVDSSVFASGKGAKAVAGDDAA